MSQSVWTVAGYRGWFPYEVHRRQPNLGLVQRMTDMGKGRERWWPEDAPVVPEIRYDLEAASAYALAVCGRSEPVQAVCGGLDPNNADLLLAARLDLCDPDVARRLGWRGWARADG